MLSKQRTHSCFLVDSVQSPQHFLLVVVGEPGLKARVSLTIGKLSNTDLHLQSVFIWGSGPIQWLRLTLNSCILLIQLPQKLGFQAPGSMLYLAGSGLYTNGTHDCYVLNYICVCAHAHTPVSVLAHLCTTVCVQGQRTTQGSWFSPSTVLCAGDQTKSIRLGGKHLIR